MEVKGKVIKITEKQTGTSQKGEWSKYSIIVDNGNKYNNILAIEVFNDKIECPKVNDIVNIECNISSREYNGNYYTQVSAWKINNEQPSEQNEIKEAQTGSENLPF